MRKIILLEGLVAGGVALSVTASANNWLLYLPAILAGSGGGTSQPPVTTESNKWLLFLPAILGGSQSQPPVVTASSFNDTGIITTVGSTGEEDADHGRDADAATNSDTDGHAGFSFTQVNSTCVLDNVTGLAWEVKTDDAGVGDKDNTYDWAEATAYAEGFVGCGGSYTCRLPTVKELFGIVSYNSSSAPIDSTFFPNNVVNAYWTSTPFANAAGVDPVNAWVMNFAVPYVDNNAVGDSFYVRAICE